MQLLCPLDSLPLETNGSSLSCSKGHSYDFAREGYCNLLLVQNKATADPGDNKEMVEARRKFLQTGHFSPIANKIGEICATIPHEKILDAGCGEGYYLEELQRAFPKSQFLGIDISKNAIKMAAKQNKAIQWVVASNRKLPVEPSKLDLILSIFGFPLFSSFKGVAHILLIDPAPNHLMELRQAIYSQVKETKLVSIEEAFSQGYKLVREEKLDFTFSIGDQVQDLLAMTPHAYRISKESRSQLDKVSFSQISASVVLRLLQHEQKIIKE